MKRGLLALGIAALLAAAGARVVPRPEDRPGAAPGAGIEAVSGGNGLSGAPESVAEEEASPETHGRRQTTRQTLVAKMPERKEAPRSALENALHWLVKSQSAAGNWGIASENLDGATWSPASATALAALALMGAGYTPLNRQEWAEGSPGEAVKRAEEWLAGVRPAGDREAALVALALSEDFGLTGEEVLLQFSGRAVADLEVRQHPNGSWGDAIDTAWAVMALKSAEISGVAIDGRVKDLARSWCSRQLETGSPSDALVWILLTHEKNAAIERILRESTQRVPTADAPAFEASYFGSLAAFQYDGPGGPMDRCWTEALNLSLASSQGEDGGWSESSGWTARVVCNALGALSLERYYAYPNPFTGKSKDAAGSDEPAAAPMPLPEDALPMGDHAPLDAAQDSGSDLLMGDSAPLEPEEPFERQ